MIWRWWVRVRRAYFLRELQDILATRNVVEEAGQNPWVCLAHGFFSKEQHLRWLAAHEKYLRERIARLEEYL